MFVFVYAECTGYTVYVSVDIRDGSQEEEEEDKNKNVGRVWEEWGE